MLKRKVHVSLLAVFAFAGMMAAAQAETWRLAHIMPSDSIEGRVHQRFAELVEQYTDNRMHIKVYPAGQLGKTPALLQHLRAGMVDIFPEGMPILHRYIEDITWIGLPFMFDNREHWVRFMNSRVVKGWQDDVRTQVGITFIGDTTSMIRGPYRVLASTKPINSISDIKSLKLRIFENKLFVQTWQHLGAEVIVLGWKDVYESLRRGVVEGVTAPISLIEPMKFYEPAKSIIRTNEFPQAIAYMANDKAWQALGPDIRRAMLKAKREVSELAVRLTRQAAADTIARIQSSGTQYGEPDMSEFFVQMRHYYQQLVKDGEMPADIFAAIDQTRKSAQ